MGNARLYNTNRALTIHDLIFGELSAGLVSQYVFEKLLPSLPGGGLKLLTRVCILCLLALF